MLFFILFFIGFVALPAWSKAKHKQKPSQAIDTILPYIDREIIHLSSSSEEYKQPGTAASIFKSDFDLNKGSYSQSTVEEAMLSRPRLFTFANLPETVKSESCILCLSKFEKMQDEESYHEIFKTRCSHYLHLKCLDSWKKNGRNTCPNCHLPLEKDIDDIELMDINFETITLGSLIKLLAEKKGLNYVLSKDLATIKLSLKTYKPMSIDRAWQIMLTLLDMHDFTHTITGNLHKFIAKKDGTTDIYPLFSSAKGVTPNMLPETDQIIRYIYFLKNITTDLTNSILGTLLSEKPVLVGDLNVLVMRDRSRIIKQAMRIIEELDVGGMRQSIAIVPLKYTDPDTVSSFLNEDLLGTKNGGNDRIRFFSPFKKNMKYFSSDVRIISCKDKQTLIFLGQQAEIDRIVHFVKLALDVEIGEAKSRVHIKEVKYHAPDVIRTILQKVMKSSSPNQNYFKDVVMYAESPQAYGGGGSNLGAGNRLIVACGNDDWRRISEFIDKIDKPQPTLAIEVMVIDASLSMSRALSAHLRDAQSGIIDPSFSWRVATAYPTSAGPREYPLVEQVSDPDYTAVTFGGPTNNTSTNVWGLLKILATQTNSAIIYQPFLVTQNNQQTRWDTTNTVQGAGELTQSGTNTIRRQVTLSAQTTIEITPRINYIGMINLDVNVVITEFAPSSTDGDPDRTSRNIRTTAQLGLGEVLALGGFDKSKLTTNMYRVPILSSIPILGNLFKSTSTVNTKTQQYYFIRLSAIKQQLYAEPEDYTALKVKYAKYQVDNIGNFAQSKDPFERYFFKSPHSTIQQTISDYKNERFSYIDDFVEGKTTPVSANMINDPYYNSTVLAESRRDLEGAWDKPKNKQALQQQTKLKPRKQSQNLVMVKEIKVAGNDQEA